MHRIVYLFCFLCVMLIANETEEKFFEWRVGLHYDVNFTSFSNKKINYSNSSISGPVIRLGFLLRPTNHFSVEFASGIGIQTTTFRHNGQPNTINEVDWAYIESIITDQALREQIRDAMLLGDLRGVWDSFDWTKLNYDYVDRGQFDERITSYSIPLEARFNYHINHNWIVYLGGVYHKGGLIDDGRAFIGTTYKYFDMRVGYIFYQSKNFKSREYQRVRVDGGIPLSLSIGAVF